MRKHQKFLGMLVGVHLVFLLLAYLVKAPCLTQAWDGRQYSTFCYNDLQALYHVRHLDQRDMPYFDQPTFEYPPAMALAMWGASFFSRTNPEYFLANLPVLIMASFLTVLGLLMALGPHPRIFWFAAATPIIFYAFHNWDLLAVAALALAMGFWSKSRPLASGLCLGIGVSAKLFPVFVLGPMVVSLALNLAKPENGGKLARILLGTGIGWGIFNAPVMVGSLFQEGDLSVWSGMFRFHADRVPDFGSIWHWLVPKNQAVSFEYRDLVDHASLLAGIGGTLALLANQHLKKRGVWAVSGAITCLFLLISKIHSPQYALWLLPYFVVLETPWPMIASYFAADALIYFSGFAWFGTGERSDWLHHLYVGGIFARAVLLMALIYWYGLRARETPPMAETRY